ncbi:MAG: galactokinase family protein, partial [Planctomycetia bacterium]|nr:galactokinase family protein [Planctomycetia bacterium]
MKAKDLLEKFETVFGAGEAPRIVRAPGRVNLIGEHTDYNGGFVMPMAIPESVWLAFRPLSDKTVRLKSEQFEGEASFTLGEPLLPDAPAWLAYPARVAEVLAEMLAERGGELGGIEGLIGGDVPIGAGLSSSAALEVASALAFLLAIYSGPAERPTVEALCQDRGLTTRELALVCQEAEHRVGVKCGIMDQFIAVHAWPGCAMMLDCRNLEFRHAPLAGEEARIVIIDSGKRRQLADAAYNERRAQCAEGAERLRKFDPKIELLRDVTPELFADHAADLPDVIRR